MADDPWVWIFGGPNGAGKTTLAAEVLVKLAKRSNFINADQVAQRLSPRSHENAALHSGRLIIKRCNEPIQARNYFALETTMSGFRHLTAAARAKEDEWRAC